MWWKTTAPARPPWRERLTRYTAEPAGVFVDPALFERSFRPSKIVRIVEPLSGTPRVRVEVKPVLGWSKQTPASFMGSHHVQWQGYDAPLRLTTDGSLSWLSGQS